MCVTEFNEEEKEIKKKNFNLIELLNKESMIQNKQDIKDLLF